LVEELKDASDIKKLIGKNKGEEDPILVAQRFLNIFRQLHIFDQKRRDEFNSMILSQPAEIRGAFGLLPGGSVLQEYVDELEISKGMAKSNTYNAVSSSILSSAQEKESPLAKIKNAQQAASSAQVNISGDAKLVADASFAQVLSQSVSSALMAANASKEDNFDKLVEAIKENSGNGKIVPDEKFAAILARAFSQALQYSDAGKKADIKELINAVRESRKIEWPEGISLGGANSAPTQLIADEVSFAKTIAATVAKIVQDSQNNSNLSSEIKDLAAAVRESRKIEFPEGFSLGNTSTISSSAPLISDETAFAKIIAEAMAKVINVGSNAVTSSSDIKELINAIRENNNSNAEAISKAMVSGISPLINSLEKNKNAITAPAKISLDTDSNFSEIIAKAFTQTFEISEKRHQEQTERLIAGFQEALSKDKNNSFETKNNKGKQLNQQQSSSIANEQLEKITQDFTKTLQSINDSRKSENREISQAIKETSKELLQMFAKHNTNKGYIAQTQDKEMINEIITQVAQVQSNIFQEMAKQQTTELSSIISLALKESQKTSVDTIVNAVNKLHSSHSIFNFTTPKIFSDDIENIDDAEIPDNKQDTSNDTISQITVKDKKSSVAKYIKSAFERSSSIEETPTSSADWGFSTNEQHETITNNHDDNTTIVNNNSEWEYEENDTDEPQGLEGEDWEWEYEEDNEVSGTEGEDWEWEYEENDTDISNTQSEIYNYEENETLQQGLEGEDWEWEYEEDETTEEENISLSDAPIINSQNDEIQSFDNTFAPIETPVFEDKGEIVIAELRNKQNFTDPYLMDNVGV